ncbi:hypothetical protein ACP4OV_027034 [Aristida adscensionis]
MENLIKLFNDWEIQMLVLLSFTLQVFLFFTGGLRQQRTKMFLRFSIWMAYLGADLVAIYALGYLSRHMDATVGSGTLRRNHPLAFFWAPFLLIHLGGQDTITAFSMEDNNLWLRHLLNMMVQFVLAAYILWKSIDRHSVDLLVSGIFVFVAGVIKYGERIWSLKYGSLENLESSTRDHYQLPELTVVDIPYFRTVLACMHSMVDVLDVFTNRSFSIFGSLRYDVALITRLDIELGIVYNDLYTKSVVTRTKSGVILRCISQVATVFALVMFLAADR